MRACVGVGVGGVKGDGRRWRIKCSHIDAFGQSVIETYLGDECEMQTLGILAMERIVKSMHGS